MCGFLVCTLELSLRYLELQIFNSAVGTFVSASISPLWFSLRLVFSCLLAFLSICKDVLFNSSLKKE